MEIGPSDVESSLSQYNGKSFPSTETRLPLPEINVDPRFTSFCRYPGGEEDGASVHSFRPISPIPSSDGGDGRDRPTPTHLSPRVDSGCLGGGDEDVSSIEASHSSIIISLKDTLNPHSPSQGPITSSPLLDPLGALDRSAPSSKDPFLEEDPIPKPRTEGHSD